MNSTKRSPKEFNKTENSLNKKSDFWKIKKLDNFKKFRTYNNKTTNSINFNKDVNQSQNLRSFKIKKSPSKTSKSYRGKNIKEKNRDVKNLDLWFYEKIQSRCQSKYFNNYFR